MKKSHKFGHWSAVPNVKLQHHAVYNGAGASRGNHKLTTADSCSNKFTSNEKTTMFRIELSGDRCTKCTHEHCKRSVINFLDYKMPEIGDLLQNVKLKNLLFQRSLSTHTSVYFLSLLCRYICGSRQKQRDDRDE